jgi:hypothetical protein
MVIVGVLVGLLPPEDGLEGEPLLPQLTKQMTEQTKRIE